MTALCRIVMKDVAITTSEHHLLLHQNGLQEMLNAGANVVKMFSGPLWTRLFNLVRDCDYICVIEQYFDEMEPPFSEDEVLKHNLQYIQEAGKTVGLIDDVDEQPILDRSIQHSSAYLKRMNTSL